MDLDSFHQFSGYHIFEVILYTAAIIVISFILIKLLPFLINKLTKKFDIEITFKYLLKDLIKYLIYIIAFITILSIVGIDISALVVSLGIVGISIGFAARDIISSFVSGMFLLADQTVKVGEIIEVGDIKGRVTKLGFRTTTLTTPDSYMITVPNSVLAKNPYISHTYFDDHRIDLNVLISSDINLDEFKEILDQEVSKLDWVLKDTSARIIVLEIIESGVKLKISAWGEEYSKIESYRLNLANIVKRITNEMK
jgi:small conductance mechanosensitive channel